MPGGTGRAACDAAPACLHAAHRPRAAELQASAAAARRAVVATYEPDCDLVCVNVAAPDARRCAEQAGRLLRALVDNDTPEACIAHSGQPRPAGHHATARWTVAVVFPLRRGDLTPVAALAVAGLKLILRSVKPLMQPGAGGVGGAAATDLQTKGPSYLHLASGGGYSACTLALISLTLADTVAPFGIATLEALAAGGCSPADWLDADADAHSAAAVAHHMATHAKDEKAVAFYARSADHYGASLAPGVPGASFFDAPGCRITLQHLSATQQQREALRKATHAGNTQRIACPFAAATAARVRCAEQGFVPPAFPAPPPLPELPPAATLPYAGVECAATYSLNGAATDVGNLIRVSMFDSMPRLGPALDALVLLRHDLMECTTLAINLGQSTQHGVHEAARRRHQVEHRLARARRVAVLAPLHLVDQMTRFAGVTGGSHGALTSPESRPRHVQAGPVHAHARRRAARAAAAAAARCAPMTRRRPGACARLLALAGLACLAALGAACPYHAAHDAERGELGLLRPGGPERGADPAAAAAAAAAEPERIEFEDFSDRDFLASMAPARRLLDANGGPPRASAPGRAAARGTSRRRSTAPWPRGSRPRGSGRGRRRLPRGSRARGHGVTRVLSEAWAVTEINSAAEDAMKARLRRGGAAALNIYIIRPASGTLGWSTFPWEMAKLGVGFDGVVVHVGTLPGGTMAPYNRGYTMVHEVGHWLGLLHVFENGCSAAGDSVDDTPPQASAAYGCPLQRDTCPGGGRDPVTNYMGYTDDACMTGFTRGQAERILAMWDVYRADGGDEAPPPLPAPGGAVEESGTGNAMPAPLASAAAAGAAVPLGLPPAAAAAGDAAAPGTPAAGWLPVLPPGGGAGAAGAAVGVASFEALTYEAAPAPADPAALFAAQQAAALAAAQGQVPRPVPVYEAPPSSAAALGAGVPVQQAGQVYQPFASPAQPYQQQALPGTTWQAWPTHSAPRPYYATTGGGPPQAFAQLAQPAPQPSAAPLILGRPLPSQGGGPGQLGALLAAMGSSGRRRTGSAQAELAAAELAAVELAAAELAAVELGAAELPAGIVPHAEAAGARLASGRRLAGEAACGSA
ncbi:MEP1 [Scenedesmus sp. PABB004]|nr:MEP1 [Scenedesmus sp. PABB004]